ncbi:CCN family member 4-like isoform X2 [Xyrauchen texanus]|uniref:CCN family member 4-like isoform X2 n=1 Tax=Xyrauchen texanus TaxID=154827 RepID=UPI0022426555|nr:CCN family member 4-like isoform X2 [Xyrauchen texanus]
MWTLLSWIFVTASLHQASSQNSTDSPLMTTDLDPYNRNRYCKWPCKCPKSAPVCPPGVSLLTDGCDCCKACAKQVGETCNERDTCDYHKGLYCDYSADKPRYEKGVCAYVMGTGCEYNGVIYRNGQSFQPNCKYRCLCVNGAIGCVPLCTESQPPRVWCQRPKRVKIPGQCCNKWICEESRKPRKTNPRHAPEEVSLTTNNIWQKNCITQTTPWSPCSKTCGRGISMRISNDNAECVMEKDSRLCNLRPCEVDITKHFRIFRTSPSQAASVRSRIGPSTVESVLTSAAASPTSQRPLRWSFSVLMDLSLPGNTCGSTPASATSLAGIQTISLQIWSNTMISMRLLTNTLTKSQMQC